MIYFGGSVVLKVKIKVLVCRLPFPSCTVILWLSITPCAFSSRMISSFGQSFRSLHRTTPLLEFKVRCGDTEIAMSPSCFRDRSMPELVLSFTLTSRHVLSLSTWLKLMFSAQRPLSITNGDISERGQSGFVLCMTRYL